MELPSRKHEDHREHMYRGGVTDEDAKDRKMETVDPLWHPLKGVAERRSIQKEKQNKVVELTIEKK